MRSRGGRATFYPNRKFWPIVAASRSVHKQIGMLLRNRLCGGITGVPEFGVRDRRSDFKPLISEAIFYKAQAVPSGKVPVVAPLLKRRPDRPLRGSSDSLYKIKGPSCSSVEMTPSEFTSRPRF
jgi:hypothetical protein